MPSHTLPCRDPHPVELTALLGGGGSIAVAMGDHERRDLRLHDGRRADARPAGRTARSPSLMATLLVDHRAPARPAGHGGAADRRRARATSPRSRGRSSGSPTAPRSRSACCCCCSPRCSTWSCASTACGTAALLAVVSVPFTIMGGQAGILQGERRWGALSVLYVLSGVPRLVIGTALIALAAQRVDRAARHRPRRLRAGRRRLVVPAPPARPGRAQRGARLPPGDPRVGPQLPGAARVLRALQRRHRDRPQRARRARRRPVRRRPDPDQGGAVPAAVRRRRSRSRRCRRSAERRRALTGEPRR